MDFIIDFILHIDHYMVEMVQQYHTWTYAILFAVIFCETGLVVTPFLPDNRNETGYDDCFPSVFFIKFMSLVQITLLEYSGIRIMKQSFSQKAPYHIIAGIS